MSRRGTGLPKLKTVGLFGAVQGANRLIIATVLLGPRSCQPHSGWPT